MPTVMHGSITWTLNLKKKKGEDLEMMFLRNICCIMRCDRVRNSLIRKRCWYGLRILKRMELNARIEWLGECSKSAYR